MRVNVNVRVYITCVLPNSDISKMTTIILCVCIPVSSLFYNRTKLDRIIHNSQLSKCNRSLAIRRERRKTLLYYVLFTFMSAT